MPKSYVAELEEGAAVTSYFLVRDLQLRQRRTGEPFLTLLLGDRTGEVAAVAWQNAEELSRGIAPGDIVKVQGALGSYQRERQLTVTRLRKAADDEFNLEDYHPRSQHDPDALLARLQAAVAEVGQPHLQRLLRDLLTCQEIGVGLRQAPAAKSLHHATLGGLLEHTVSVVELCARLADHYPALDRDLLRAAALLHDIGKIREFTWERVFDYTDDGRLLGHIVLGVMLVEEQIRRIPEFPESLARRLLHCILSHHGELEWGSPKRPKILEALVLHYAENLDGKVNAFLAFAQSHPDPQRPGWTRFNRTMDRYLYFGTEREGDPPGGAGEPAASGEGEEA